MKNSKLTFKMLSGLLVLSLYVNSCQRDNNAIEVIEKKAPLNGSWSETTSVNKTNNNSYSNDDIAHREIIIKDFYIYQYFNGVLIAKIPFKIERNKIIIHDPHNNEVLSTLMIDEEGNISNSLGVVYEKTNLSETNSLQTNNKNGLKADFRRLCLEVCKETHRLLGLPTLIDRICCFWYPTE